MGSQIYHSTIKKPYTFGFLNLIKKQQILLSDFIVKLKNILYSSS